MKPLRFVDLFCGIGGFRYGLEIAARKRDVPTEYLFPIVAHEKIIIA
ncbi:MAG: hypothetical protein ABL911_03290 [Gallionella sp.]|nr:DNA cytosine methyltransferase [Gallionella sp.]